MNKFYCVSETYYRNGKAPLIRQFTVNYVVVPNHAVKEYDDYIEHTYFYKDKKQADNHYKRVKLCVDIAGESEV